MNAPGPILLDETEAARLLRLSERSLRKLRAAGQLSYILIGRAVRYSLADLEQFIDSHRTKDAPCPTPVPRPKSAARGRTGEIVPFTARRR